MDKNLKIPTEKRHEFSQPLGELIPGTRKSTISIVVQRVKELIKSGGQLQLHLVGDVVSEDIINNEFLRKYIKTSIVDEKTQRKEKKMGFDKYFDRIELIKNPIGSINMDSFDLFRDLLTFKGKTLIKVIEGEEDLLVLPLISCLEIASQVKHLVFYGQPPITDSKDNIPEGIVLVDVNRRIQKSVNKFLELMKS